MRIPAPPSSVRTTKPRRKNGRVEVEVAAEAAGDAGEHAVGGAALEALDARGMCDVFAHVSRLPARRLRRLSGITLVRPSSTLLSCLMAEKLIAENRRARHDYQLLERIEAGHRADRHRGEVAARRAGDAGAGLRRHPRRRGVAARRSRSRRTTRATARTTSRCGRASCCCTGARSTRSTAQVREKGLTLVPTRLYFKDGRVKVELAVARGKEQRDKRRDVVERDAKRQMERALKSRR